MITLSLVEELKALLPDISSKDSTTLFKSKYVELFFNYFTRYLIVIFILYIIHIYTIQKLLDR